MQEFNWKSKNMSNEYVQNPPKSVQKRQMLTEVDIPAPKRSNLETAEIKQEPIIINQEPIIINQEPIIIKQEPIFVETCMEFQKDPLL